MTDDALPWSGAALILATAAAFAAGTLVVAGACFVVDQAVQTRARRRSQR